MARKPKAKTPPKGDKPSTRKKQPDSSVGVDAGVPSADSANMSVLDKMQAVLESTGVVEPGAKLTPEEISGYYKMAVDDGLIPKASVNKVYEGIVEDVASYPDMADDAPLDTDVVDSSDRGPIDTDVDTDVEDEFVSSEPVPDRDIPPDEGLDDLDDVEDMEPAGDVEVDDVDAGGPSDNERLAAFLEASQLGKEAAKKANPDYKNLFLGGGPKSPRSKAAKEVVAFLERNGYKLNESGKIADTSPALNPKKKPTGKSKQRPVETDDVVGSEDVLPPEEDFTPEADADLDDVGGFDEGLDPEAATEKPKRSRSKKGKTKKDKGPVDKETAQKGQQPKGNWYDSYVDPVAMRDADMRAYAFANDPGPNAPRQQQAAFLNDLNARGKERVTAEKLATEKKAKKAAKRQKRETEERAARNKTYKRGLLLGGAELTRELVQGAREGFEESPGLDQPILMGLNYLTGGGTGGGEEAGSTSARQALEDRLSGKSGLTGYQKLKQMSERKPADTMSNPVDTIRANRGT